MSEVLFPPRSNRRAEIEALAGMLASAVSSRNAVYVATPITSGPRFADWFACREPGVEPGTPVYRAEHRRHVIDPNCSAAAAAVRRLRSHFSGVVIDPTAVALPGVEQADYHVLWASVIERYAGTVVFLDGWEYSVGCAYEFLTALRTGATPLESDLSLLGQAEGMAAIRHAAIGLRQREIATGFLEAVLSELTCPAEANEP